MAESTEDLQESNASLTDKLTKAKNHITNMEAQVRNLRNKIKALRALDRTRYLEAEVRELKGQVHILTNRDPHTKWIMCGRKKSFTTRGAALRVAEKFGTCRVYECPICFCFHTTSQPTHEEKVLDRLNNPLDGTSRIP